LREDESVSKKRVKNAQMRKRTATATYWQPFYGALTDFAIGQTSLLSRSSWMAVYVCVLVAKKKRANQTGARDVAFSHSCILLGKKAND